MSTRRLSTWIVNAAAHAVAQDALPAPTAFVAYLSGVTDEMGNIKLSSTLQNVLEAGRAATHLTKNQVQIFCNQLFCKDCDHFFYSKNSTAYCSAPDAKKIDLVLGPINQTCILIRSAEGPCGIEARLFVPKTPDEE